MAGLSGPSLEPKSGKTRRLVVFLHGYGADGNDLIDIGRAWQPILPDTAFVSPHAPEPCGQAPVGRQWFGLTFRDPDERWVGVNQAAPVLNEFLDAELARRQLPPDALALVGFSQGTMMALHVALRRPRMVAAVVGYSGMLTGSAELAHRDFAKPPVLLVHGTADPVVPIAALHMAEGELKRLGVPVTTHISFGVAHSVDPVGLRLGREFVAEAFKLAS